MSAAFQEIIYIMGAGRSGTTILEVLLANNRGFTGVGEVTHIFKDGFIENALCSCGKQTSGCMLWSFVRDKCQWHSRDIRLAAKLFHDVAWHTRFWWVALNLVSDENKIHYRELNECLFEAVTKKTGAEVIVDSSKYAGRALLLANLFPDRVRVICLVRSPAGLVAAFTKTGTDEQKPKPIWAILLYYFYVMLCMRVVAVALGRRTLLVRYEDLCADPQGTLLRIGRWCARDMSELIGKITINEELNVGHIVTGNRLRKKGKVRFRPVGGAIAVTGWGARFAVWCMDLYRMALRF